MRALFTTDGSKEACAAMRAAGRLLARESREVRVLYVAQPPRLPKSGSASTAAYQQRAAAETKRVLEEAKRVLGEESIDAVTYCRSGSPSGVIMHESEKYDLTVLGAKGREIRSEVGLGPVASRLAEHATGCVLIGREPPEDKQVRILVALDSSEGSSQALEALLDFFDLDAAEITLLHVLETLWLPQEEEDPDGPADSDAEQTGEVLHELRREARELLTEAHVRVLKHHPGVITAVREGIPANEILSEADQGEYDLVVVGANAGGDMKHSVLGSVSNKVAWNAPCSVLIVRAED